MKKMLLLCCLIFSQVSAKIIYVSPEASGSEDGSSFENSLGSISSGIHAAGDGDTVLLNTGVYQSTFHVIIQEWFTRITIASRYILSGDTSDIANTIIDCQGNTSYCVFHSVADLDTTSTIAGITFQDFPYKNQITAIYFNDKIVKNSSGPRFRKCNFFRNAYVFFRGSFLADSCLFLDNKIITFMSGSGTSFHMRDCTVKGTTDRIAHCDQGARLTITRCEISDNKPESDQTLLISNRLFISKSNFTGNGGPQFKGGLIGLQVTTATDTALIEKCTFAYDTISGGLFNSAASCRMVFDSCQIHHNVSSYIFARCNNLYLKQCLIYSNSGIIILDKSTLYPTTITGSTIANNFNDGAVSTDDTIRVINSIITDTLFYGLSFQTKARVEGRYSLMKLNPSRLLPSSRLCILNRDPLFINPSLDDYHVHPYSPTIDAGDPDSSNTRENQYCYGPNDNIVVDMGYYGNSPGATCKMKSSAEMGITGTMRPILYIGEIAYDTLKVTNAGPTDTIITYDTAAVTTEISGLTCLRVSPNYTLLKPGDSCLVFLRHEGTASGNSSGIIDINFNSASYHTFDYSGFVFTKTFDDIFDNSWACPATVVGSEKTTTFPLKNKGNNPITITGITHSSSELKNLYVADAFPITIQPGDSVILSADFAPQAEISYSVTFSISTPNIAGGVDNSLVFTGSGVLTGITVAPKNITYESVLVGETDSSQILTIRNENPNVSLDVTGITFDDPQFSISGNKVFTLASGDVRSLFVSFKPTSTGTKSATLTIHNTSVLDSTSKVTLSGTGVKAGLSMSATVLNLGNIPAGTYKDDSISVTSNGTGTLKIDTISSSDSNFIVLGNAGQRQVEPNASFWLKVRFNPHDSTKALTKTISIVSNATGSPHSLSVSGTGTRSSLSASISAVNFGKRSLTASFDTVITISNTGNALVTITDTNTTSAAFRIISYPATIAAGENEEITIRFKSPVADGGDFLDAAVSLAYTDGSTSSSVSVTVSAKAAARPYCDSLDLTPASALWDTSGHIAFQAFADDSDDAGTGARIAKYLWSSSVDGALSSTAGSFTLKPSALSIGVHSISCRVIDNEGDTSSAATASLTINNRLPHASVLSISPEGLILKGSGDVIFTGEGWDMDQFADNNDDSLKSFQWYSTIQGLLGSGKKLTINSSELELGNHGFYVKAVDNENATAYSDTLLVPVQAGIGRALIVAGTAFDDHTYFTKNIAPNCNWAYQKLLDRGFSNEQIHYMNPVGWQSLKDPFTDSKIVDNTTVTLDALRKFMLSNEVKNDVKNSVPLIVYLLGHGSSALNNGRFYLNKTEYLTPDTLAEWLDSYGDLPSSAQVILILDFCYSGSFQSKLRTSVEQNRVVITSSDAANAAYFNMGKCFSWNIWNDVYRGKDLAEAFRDALNWSDASAPGTNKANPQINCDNNSAYSTNSDFNIAKTIFIGGSQQLQTMTSIIDSASADAPADGITITAHVKGVFDKVWCRLYGPDIDPAQSSPPAVRLEQVNDSTWRGVYTGDRKEGDYLIVTEGTDGDGKFIMGVYCEVTNEFVVSAKPLTEQKIPKSVFLGAVHPNPIIGSAVISYGLPRDMNVDIWIYDLRGRRVATLVNVQRKAGYYQVRWNLGGADGHRVGAGHYICRLVAGKKVVNGRLLVSQ
ncbi:MAG: choice-of-anchor D domain-containing protein [Fibrobacter sp.]|nr:choice-of-anchor D domain-containing protein [Fibrobacter sp.]